MLKSLERSLKIAETNLLTAQKMLAHSNDLFKRGYVTELEVEGNAFTVTQAELELKVIQTEIDVLNKYTKEMQLETLNGNLKASKSKPHIPSWIIKSCFICSFLLVSCDYAFKEKY